MMRTEDGSATERVEERLFSVRNDFQAVADFEQRMIQATHTEQALSPEL